MSVKLFIESLTVSQLKYAKNLIQEVLRAEDEKETRYVWQIITIDSICTNFAEEDFEYCVDVFLKMYKAEATRVYKCFLENKSVLQSRELNSRVPRIHCEPMCEKEYIEYSESFERRPKSQEGSLIVPKFLRKTLEVPAKNGVPTITNEMKKVHIGEYKFSIPDLDEEGWEISREVTVPWDLCKEIYKNMAVTAAKGGDSTAREYL